MISYIIPTLWKSKFIFETIDSFKQINDDKAELIIIDNNQSDFTDPDPRIKVFRMRQNIFVNPSWNLGVSFSTNDKVCIVNDDINFNLPRFHKFVLETGVKAVCYNSKTYLTTKDEDEYKLIQFTNPNRRPPGIGQMMYLHKENWTELPYEMKLWYGDDIIYYYHTLVRNIPFHYIEGMALLGEQSVSVNSDIIPESMRQPFTQDTLEYYKKMHTLGLETCTVMPDNDLMAIKMAWKYNDIDTKLEYEKTLHRLING